MSDKKENQTIEEYLTEQRKQGEKMTVDIPKFMPGDKVFYLDRDNKLGMFPVEKATVQLGIKNNEVKKTVTYIVDTNIHVYEEDLFGTPDEALAEMEKRHNEKEEKDASK